MSWNGYYQEIDITQYDMVRCGSLREMSVDKFIKYLGKKINKYDIEIHSNFHADISYGSGVYKEEENIYRIHLGSRDYRIDTEKYPFLIPKLDEFCRVTTAHRYEKDCCRKIEDDGKGTTEENKAYLNYLKVAKKDAMLSNIRFLSPLAVVPSVIVIAYFLITHGASDTLAVSEIFLGTLATIVSLVVSIDEFIENGRSLIENIRMVRLIKRKMSRIKKKIRGSRKVSFKNNAVVSNRVTKEELYRDSIINYMNSIMNSANKLDDKNKKEKLLALREILDEYTSKSRELNNTDSKELTLNGGNRDVMKRTIDKLTILEMEIADLLNQKLFSDNEKFMEELNKNIDSIENHEVMTSSGKVLRR